MAPEGLVERVESARAVGVFERHDLLEQIRMAADRALAELDQRAGDDIGAFHRDRDRHAAIKAAEIIQRAFDDRLAAMHVHGVVDGDAHAVGRLRFHDRGDDRRMVSVIERGAGHAARGVELISGRGDAAEPLLHRLELRDRDVELLADARIGAGDIGAERRARRRQRRQRNAASGRQRAHQHFPALADLVDAADDIVHRNEDVVAPVRSVLEHVHGRKMTPPDADAGQMRRHQRERDADIVALADQMIGIVQLEGKPEHGRDRAERDVALVPVEPDAEHVLARHKCRGTRRRYRSSRRRRSRLPDWSGRSTEFPRRAPAAAASNPAAPWCRIASAVRPGRASSAPWRCRRRRSSVSTVCG